MGALLYSMKFIFTIIFLTAFYFQSKAQYHELGLSILKYDHHRTNYTFPDTSNYAVSKGIGSFQPVLLYTYVTKKNTDLFCQAGYFFTSQKASEKSYTSGSLTHYDYNYVSQKSFFFKLGIAKRYNRDKLSFISGVNIPAECIYYRHAEKNIEAYNGNIHASSTQDTYTFNPEYITGIFLQQSVFYKLTKRIYLGVDMNIGMRVTIINAAEVRTTSYKDLVNPVNNYDTQTSIENKRNVDCALTFIPTLSVKYNFKKHDK